jgi:hypothetical protein
MIMMQECYPGKAMAYSFFQRFLADYVALHRSIVRSRSLLIPRCRLTSSQAQTVLNAVLGRELPQRRSGDSRFLNAKMRCEPAKNPHNAKRESASSS